MTPARYLLIRDEHSWTASQNTWGAFFFAKNSPRVDASKRNRGLYDSLCLLTHIRAASLQTI